MSLIPKKGTVYVVDDDEGVRDSLQWLLEGKDYRVRCYDSAETFLSRYDPREVACLIVEMPEIHPLPHALNHKVDDHIVISRSSSSDTQKMDIVSESY